MWYLYQFRRVVICTDSLWNSAYLLNEKRDTQLKINLWNRFYLPEKRVFALNEGTRDELAAVCKNRSRAWYLLSPYLSALVRPQQLWQAHPGSSFILWESALQPSAWNPEALSSGGAGTFPRVFHLYIDHDRLASAFIAALKPLLSSVTSETAISETALADQDEPRTVRIYYHRQGRFSASEIRALSTEIEAQIQSVRLQPVDLSASSSAAELQITSEDIVLIAGGEAAEFRQLLTRIENRGARAVVFGDASGSGWPKGVAAEISIDLEATLLDLIETPEGSAKVKEKVDRNSEQNPAVQRFALRFRIRREFVTSF